MPEEKEFSPKVHRRLQARFLNLLSETFPLASSLRGIDHDAWSTLDAQFAQLKQVVNTYWKGGFYAYPIPRAVRANEQLQLMARLSKYYEVTAWIAPAGKYPYAVQACKEHREELESLLARKRGEGMKALAP